MHGRSLGVNGLLVVACALLVASCKVDPVHISDRCEPLTDAVLLHPLIYGRFSVGLVDGYLLFSYVIVNDDEERKGSWFARWFDRELRPLSAVFWLGDSTMLGNTQWVAHEGRLWGQIWAVPQESGPLPPTRSQLGIYALTPGSTDFERIARNLPISAIHDTERDVTPVGDSIPSINAGLQGLDPAAVAHGRPIFTTSAIPASCPPGTTFPIGPLMVFDTEDVYVHLYGDDPCSLDPPDRSRWAHASTLVPLRNGGLGVLYRLGSGRGLGRIHYARIGPDLRVLDVPPILVGSTTRHYSVPGGYQPRALALGSGTILFTERTEENSTNVCSNLRLVEPDGSNARHAPWQLSCWLRPGAMRAREYAPTLSAWIDLVPLGNGHAAIAWGERTNFPPGREYVTRLTLDVPWEEGVYLTTINGQGQRAAEVVRVTPPESTAVIGAGTPRTETFGPFPGEFEVRAASEGDEVVVGWRDLRPDAPGYYGRRFRCGPLPSPPGE